MQVPATLAGRSMVQGGYPVDLVFESALRDADLEDGEAHAIQ